MSDQSVSLDARSFLKTYGFLAGLMLFYVLFQLCSLNYGYHHDELYDIIMSAQFESVEEAARTEVKYAMPYEYDKPIFVCRNLKAPLDKAWAKSKHYN